jgi:hypothetical protein
MKKINLGILLVGLLTITGCAAVQETFDAHQFHTQEFSENYYRFIPDKYKNEELYLETVTDISGQVSFASPYENAHNAIILNDIAKGYITMEQAVELYGDEQVKSFNASWFSYARHNNLTSKRMGESVVNAFKAGIFSKLTDSLIVCNGDGPLVRMQIDEDGVGQVFKHELINYQNFVITARGGTSVNYRELGIPNVTKARVMMELSFFIEKSTTSQALKHTIKYEVPELNVDDNSITTVMSMDLSLLLPKDTLKRVSGMTIKYELLEHDYLMPGGVKDTTKSEEFALMLYEIMFPFSEWR